MLSGMGRDAETEPMRARRHRKFAHYVTMGAHAGGIPRRDIGVVHGEAVAVFTDGNDVARAGLNKKADPRIGIEALRFEQWDEVLVTELGLTPISSNVMFEGRVPGNVHVARVPLVSECRNGVHTPVQKDAELGITKPLRSSVRCERFPARVKRHMCQICFRANSGNLMGRVRRPVLRWHGLREDDWSKTKE